ncbi:MAG TPA: SIS domain-containing protein [Verrucomicrobiae bacterium]|nr:SIS domain-containing protein [Verrucomicrobiae bacterium]
MEPVLSKITADACRTLQALATEEATFQRIASAAVTTLRAGGKILACGNGGSAADAMHLTQELIGHFRGERRSLPAVSLTADPTALTCIGNDFGFEYVFSRQIEGLADKNDLLVVFSTSGNSPNILHALDAARAKGVKTVALLGKGGGKAKGKADFEIVIANTDSGRVQEAHTVILHALLDVIERQIGS